MQPQRYTDQQLREITRELVRFFPNEPEDRAIVLDGIREIFGRTEGPDMAPDDCDKEASGDGPDGQN